MEVFKPSPNTGKVAAEPSEGVSVSRYARMGFTERYKYLPVILERSDGK